MGEKAPVTMLSEGILIESDIDKINEYLPVLDKFNLELHKENNQLYLLIKRKDSLASVMCKSDDIKLIKDLENTFSDTKFKIIRNEYLIELLYDNKKYINDDKFSDKVFDIAQLHLCEDDLWKLGTTYDLLNRIGR